MLILKAMFKKLFNFFTVDKYYKMSNSNLENEAAKWHIGGYATGIGGIIDRQIIIDALIKKDVANNSRVALFLSVVAIFVTILGLFLK